MLPAQYRMRASGDFATAMRRGKRRKTHTAVVYVWYLPRHTKADLTKVGFVVSKKVGNSVVRHRVVRQLRHIVCATLPFVCPALVVVRAHPSAASASFQRLETDLRTALEQLGVISHASAPAGVIGGDAAISTLDSIEVRDAVARDAKMRGVNAYGAEACSAKEAYRADEHGVEMCGVETNEAKLCATKHSAIKIGGTQCGNTVAQEYSP